MKYLQGPRHFFLDYVFASGFDEQIEIVGVCEESHVFWKFQLEGFICNEKPVERTGVRALLAADCIILSYVDVTIMEGDLPVIKEAAYNLKQVGGAVIVLQNVQDLWPPHPAECTFYV
ncbi:hypothetical protein AVEN_204934-1 [Araneus ventricosus]|uniref:Uncharacterized protein n=1 Tax=Araneus ventricosus TaxID=182803 RepID=A0A4Y2M119_ARAVE|nr:hypothetical protein AVEN_204934-1 [Araneus ventricosus]